MFEKKIIFSCDEYYEYDEKIAPEPIKFNIPEWFKNLKDNENFLSIKHCMPFLDTLTSGYVLKLYADFKIEHNSKDENGCPKAFQFTKMYEWKNDISKLNLNINLKPEYQHPLQALDSGFLNKNKNLPFHKILNPWKITTPTGYSCLFVSPLNNEDDRFSIISGIVDTDTWDRPINFPIVINGDKYPVLKTILKKSTPYVQIIPFKRDAWKMQIQKVNSLQKTIKNVNYASVLKNFYKNNFWNKKKWS